MEIQRIYLSPKDNKDCIMDIDIEEQKKLKSKIKKICRKVFKININVDFIVINKSLKK